MSKNSNSQNSFNPLDRLAHALVMSSTKMNSTTLSVYLYFLWGADRITGDVSFVNTGCRTLAHCLNISKDSVLRAERDLIRRGVLQIFKGPKGTPSKFKLKIPPNLQLMFETIFKGNGITGANIPQDNGITGATEMVSPVRPVMVAPVRPPIQGPAQGPSSRTISQESENTSESEDEVIDW